MKKIVSCLLVVSVILTTAASSVQPHKPGALPSTTATAERIVAVKSMSSVLSNEDLAMITGAKWTWRCGLLAAMSGLLIGGAILGTLMSGGAAALVMVAATAQYVGGTGGLIYSMSSMGCFEL